MGVRAKPTMQGVEGSRARGSSVGRPSAAAAAAGGGAAAVAIAAAVGDARADDDNDDETDSRCALWWRSTRGRARRPRAGARDRRRRRRRGAAGKGASLGDDRLRKRKARWDEVFGLGGILCGARHDPCVCCLLLLLLLLRVGLLRVCVWCVFAAAARWACVKKRRQ
jgi:hypothetical protein